MCTLWLESLFLFLLPASYGGPCVSGDALQSPPLTQPTQRCVRQRDHHVRDPFQPGHQCPASQAQESGLPGDGRHWGSNHNGWLLCHHACTDQVRNNNFNTCRERERVREREKHVIYIFIYVVCMCTSVTPRDRTVYVQFSKHQELKTTSVSGFNIQVHVHVYTCTHVHVHLIPIVVDCSNLAVVFFTH